MEVVIRDEESSLFFRGEQGHFFRPLTGKYREKARACIKELYLRLNGPAADCRYHLSKADIVDAFAQELRNAPELDEDDGVLHDGRQTDEALAKSLLDRLKDCSWIEEYQDGVEMRTAYRFTPNGRIFAKAFVDVGRERFRASHRNTRNTRNALAAYLEHRDPHDLIEAYSFAQEIFNDFNESLEEITLMQQEQTQAITENMRMEQASEDFFTYLQQRFMPDISKMLGDESVNRYRNEIIAQCETLRQLSEQDRIEMELSLRSEAPNLKRDGRSTLAWMLDEIERRIDNACDVKLPELRKALETFTRRSHLIIQQLMRIHAADQHDVAKVCRRLSELPGDERDSVLEATTHWFSMGQASLVDPGRIAQRKRRSTVEIDTEVTERAEPSVEERLQAQIARALDSAFTVEDGPIAKKFYDLLLNSDSIRAQVLTISSVDDLFMAMHALSVASNSHDLGIEFAVEETGSRVENDFFSGNDYRISVRRQSP